MQERLRQGPKNGTYTSPEIQNSILHVMGDMVRKMVSDGVKQAGLYTLMADESKDCSKLEQFAISFCYVNVETGTVYERFLTYVQATSCTAESLTSYILDVLNNHQIDPSKMVCQCYDGASVMSGHCSGVQSRVKQFALRALYIRCYAHCLNLILVDCAKSVPMAWDFFAAVSYTFMSAFKAHTAFLRFQKELYPDKAVHQLQKLSDTRWACRQAAVHAICYTFDAVLATLEEICDGDDRDKAVEAKGFLLQIKCFKFVVSLVVFDRILSCSRCLSDALQSTQLDLAKATDLVLATKQTFEEFRTDQSWNKVYDYAVRIADHHSINVTVPSRQQRQTRLPKRLEDTVVLTFTGHRDVPVNCSDHYKTTLYFAVLDTFVSELNRRFDSKNMKIMKAIQACSPEAKNVLCPEDLSVLAKAWH